jgi:hypothetical protein
MTSYDEFSPESTEVSTALTPSEKAAAVLLAMGKPVAGKLLKFFEYEELQEIIKKAQNLRTIKPQELVELVNEFEESVQRRHRPDGQCQGDGRHSGRRPDTRRGRRASRPAHPVPEL